MEEKGKAVSISSTYAGQLAILNQWTEACKTTWVRKTKHVEIVEIKKKQYHFVIVYCSY